jgi:predicted acyltransferase
LDQAVAGMTRSIPIVSSRLESLDALRGLAVCGMLMVNFSLGAEGYLHLESPATLSHSPWAGFTFADAVFPAFLFIVGASIGASGRSFLGVDAALVRAALARSVRLFALGFLLTNVTWLWMHDWSFSAGVRPTGVLQRIAICYCVTLLLYRSIPLRFVVGIAILLLAAYWPLALIPLPDGTLTDLTVRGQNFVSWFDRAVLGPHRFVEGPTGYDSEGLLSTLPAIAQCLLGAAAGHWIVARAASKSSAVAFALAGALIAAAGLLWGEDFPIVKDMWSSSFVLLSSGVTMATLGLIQLLMSLQLFPQWLASFLTVFGRNAILAYSLYMPGLIVLAIPLTSTVYRTLASNLSGGAASLALAFGFMLLIWLPLAIVHRRGHDIRI